MYQRFSDNHPVHVAKAIWSGLADNHYTLILQCYQSDLEAAFAHSFLDDESTLGNLCLCAVDMVRHPVPLNDFLLNGPPAPCPPIHPLKTDNTL